MQHHPVARVDAHVLLVRVVDVHVVHDQVARRSVLGIDGDEVCVPDGSRVGRQLLARRLLVGPGDEPAAVRADEVRVEVSPPPAPPQTYLLPMAVEPTSMTDWTPSRPDLSAGSLFFWPGAITDRRCLVPDAVADVDDLVRPLGVRGVPARRGPRG